MGTCAATLRGHSKEVECVAAENGLKVDSHGPLVASGSAEGAIRLWDIRSKTAIKVLVSDEMRSAYEPGRCRKSWPVLVSNGPRRLEIPCNAEERMSAGKHFLLRSAYSKARRYAIKLLRKKLSSRLVLATRSAGSFRPIVLLPLCLFHTSSSGHEHTASRRMQVSKSKSCRHNVVEASASAHLLHFPSHFHPCACRASTRTASRLW